MNITKIFETQRTLDAHINENHPVQEGEDRFSKKVLALLTELSECENEWRGFKFWSNNQEPRVKTKSICGCLMCEHHSIPNNKNPLLEEYVDCLHFIVSIGIDLNVNHEDLFVPSVTQENAVDIFISLHYEFAQIDLLRNVTHYIYSFAVFMELGICLGFSNEQIETAYYSKNKINHARQENNY
ncbi:MAG: dUTP diphosphatase [Kurthia sp.]